MLLVLSGAWLVVAGPLFHRLWLDMIGTILLALGAYLFSIGVKGPASKRALNAEGRAHRAGELGHLPANASRIVETYWSMRPVTSAVHIKRERLGDLV